MDNKTAGNIFARGINYELTKVAAIDLPDVEGELGFYLPDRFEKPVRQLIEAHTQSKPILREPVTEGAKYTGIGAGAGLALGAGLAALTKKPKLFSSIIGGLAGGAAGAGTALARKGTEENKAVRDIVGRLRRHPEVAPLAEAREQLDHDRRVELLPLLEEQEKTKRQQQLADAVTYGGMLVAGMIADAQKRTNKEAKK